MRLLLLETLHTESLRQHRVEFFPFFLGLADQLRMESAWWVLPVAPERAHEGARFVHALAEETLAALCKRAQGFAPDVALTHDRLADDTLGALRRILPKTRFVDLTSVSPEPSMTLGEARSLLTGKSGSPDDAACYFTDRVLPRVHREFPFPLPFSPEVQPRRLLVERLCRYRSPLRGNSFFAGMDEPLVFEHRGCSFCEAAMLVAANTSDYEVDPVERALRQIRAYQADETAPDGQHHFVAEEGALTDLVDRFLSAVVEAQIRPSEFVMMTRVDTLLQRRHQLEAVLEQLREQGHRLTLVSLGGENFSETENTRLHKGLSTQQLWDCFDLISELLERFPDAFSVHDEGFFAAILFTPWTRTQDLRANVEAARKLGPGWLQRAVGTRLQLWDTLPITALARRDGLVDEHFGAAGELEAVCINSPDIREVPWRFADPRTETLCRLLPRLDKLPQQALFDAENPLFCRAHETRARLVPALRDDFVALAAVAIEAVEALAPNAGPEAALDWLEHHHSAPPEPEAVVPMEKTNVEPEGNPVLAFDLQGGQTVFLSAHEPGRPCFRRVGSLALWHDERNLAPPTERFLHLLATAIERPELARTSLDTIELWRKVGLALGKKAGSRVSVRSVRRL